jgi:CubicO group peptidase (beta-lactamase class C family)
LRQRAAESPEAAGASLDSEIRRSWRSTRSSLALAVVRSGVVTQVESFGYRNLERGLPLTPETVLYGASLTKAAFGYMVLQLVDEGRLSLDTSIAALLPRPLPEYEDYGDIAGDDRWKALTPRILLTHSSGLANFRWLEEDGRLQFHFEPGTRYGYSGEGFYILQLVLEQGLGLDVGLEMQRRVFDRFAMSSTSMTWRPAFAENLADGYGTDGTMEPHDERSSVSAAGSMDTTIADQAKLWAGIVRGEGLSPASRAERVRPGLAITSLHQFPTLRPWSDPRNAEIGLSAGIGVVVFKDTTGPAWFKGGHNDWTGNMVVCLEASQDCVVMMANDVRASASSGSGAAGSRRDADALALGGDWFESSVPGRARWGIALEQDSSAAAPPQVGCGVRSNPCERWRK